MLPYSSVSSIAVDSNFRRLLVTLESSFMLEIAVDSGAVLLVTEAHSLGRLNAIAAHPINPKLLITAGADCLFRVWNAASRRVIACESLHHEATAVAFSADGSMAAVGIVGTENGGASVIIMRFDANSTVENIISVTDRIHNVGTGRISCVRFSPDAKLVAAASSDHKIYVFGTDKGFKLKAMISVFAGPVLSFDFTKSGNFLRAFSRVVSESRVEMHMFDMNKLSESRLLSGNSVPTYALIKDEVSLKQLVNETWATASAAAPEVRGSRVINESRPRAGLDDVCVAGNLCLASYSDGVAKLFRYPPASLGAEGELMRGHSVGGSRCALSCDGSIAFVAGAIEGSVLMYNIKK
jgi:WD40 repeat protein